MITGKNQIGFTQSAQGTKTYHTINPKTNANNPTIFYEATQRRKSIPLARKQKKPSPYYSKTAGIQRAKFLRAIATEIEALGPDSLIRRCTLTESALPEGTSTTESAEEHSGHIKNVCRPCRK